MNLQSFCVSCFSCRLCQAFWAEIYTEVCMTVHIWIDLYVKNYMILQYIAVLKNFAK